MMTETIRGNGMKKPKPDKILAGDGTETERNRNRRLAEQQLIDFIWGNSNGQQRKQLFDDLTTVQGCWEY